MTTTGRTFDRRVAALRLPVIIEAISEIADRPAELRIRAGGRSLVDLPVDVAARLELGEGLEIDAERCAAIRLALNRHALRRRALRLLAARPWGRAELADRLARVDWASEDDVADVVGWLAGEGLLDDAHFAAEVCRSVTRRGPVAAAHLEGLLEAKGVDADTASAAVREAIGDADPFEDALAHAERQLAGAAKLPRAPAASDPLRQARRIAGTLSRRGFDPETIERVLEHLAILPVPE